MRPVTNRDEDWGRRPGCDQRIDTGDIDAFLGLDVGKSAHHATPPGASAVATGLSPHLARAAAVRGMSDEPAALQDLQVVSDPRGGQATVSAISHMEAGQPTSSISSHRRGPSGADCR
ncbi:hypothetical protein OIU91_40715 [Streptomyces sp. NBC_01456]|uniref:hypothetical protein n=1 Tax=unclassified Streptomyces TaxID=2593676 RepID=UPI002E2EBD14|nr:MULTISPECIES: hypothetical protein [unclassified Streptomyces]